MEIVAHVVRGLRQQHYPVGCGALLFTTGAAPMDGAAWFLRSNGGRDVDKALHKLETVTQTSDSEANAAVCKAFLAVTAAARRAVLDNVMVLDRAPSVPTIDDDLKAEVH